MTARLPMDPRAEDLLLERALRPLDDDERRELAALGLDGDDDSFDRAAAAVVLATTPIEPMPPHVAERILAAAPTSYPRTLPGVVVELPRDTLVGVDPRRARARRCDVRRRRAPAAALRAARPRKRRRSCRRARRSRP